MKYNTALAILLLFVSVSRAQVVIVPVGTFSGILPDKNGNKIETYIDLNANRTGLVQERDLGENGRTIIYDITWEMKANTISLYENYTLKSKFRFSKNKLQALDSKGRLYTGEQAMKYTLHKQQQLTINKSWSEKRQKGIDIIAMGNEPSWSLEIDIEKELLFTRMGDEPIKAPVTKTVFEGGGWAIKTNSGNHTIQVLIEPLFCSDGMSERAYQYHATVTVDGKVFKGVSVLLNGSFALEGEWVMEYLNVKGPQNEWSKMPMLKFNLTEGRVSGTDGCNRIMGSFQLSDNSGLKFSKMAGTLMACPDGNSGLFTKALNKVTRFRIVSGRLELMAEEGMLIRLKRVVGN